MNGRQLDDLSMQKVVNCLWDDTTPEILALMPEIEAVKTAFKENIDTIDVLYNGQNTNRTGTRMTKDEYREDMMTKAFGVAAKTCAYAIAINDEELQMKVTYVYTDLNELRDTVVANTCNEIYSIARDLGDVLIPYGVTVETLAKLSNSITLYREIQPKTREGIVDQTLFTSQIEELLAANHKLLFRMDKLVIMLRFDKPLFYEQYFNSRKIIDTGSRKFSLKGNITNEQGQPIDAVYITVETPTPVTVKSTEKGNYQFKGIEGGVWAVTFKRNGYIEVKEYLVFTPNQRIDFNVVLKAAELQQEAS